ncbi:MAG: hypothetical protein EB100_06285, partial [Crocinitomicaceae bacterium]|nr:hypothetical protein [Crocinitomicaceae bacterium]
CILLCISCKKEANNSLYGNSSEALYFSFSTPDWSEHIDCSRLSLDATNNNVLSAQSQSTKEIFYLIVPSDSSTWSLSQNKSKHAIGTDSLFQLNQTLPLTKGASERMLGIPGFSDSSYHEVKSINYSHSDNSGAYFFIKGSYRMWMSGIYTNSTKKFVSGSYCFKVKTSKI